MSNEISLDEVLGNKKSPEALPINTLQEPISIDSNSNSYEIDFDEVFNINTNQQPTQVPTVDDVGNETPIEDDRAPTATESQALTYIEDDIVEEEAADFSIEGQEVLKNLYETSLAEITGEQAEKTFAEEEEFATQVLSEKQVAMLGPGLKEKYLESRKFRQENKEEIIKGRNIEFKNQLTERYNALNNILSGKEHTDFETGKEYSNPIRKQMVLSLLDKGYDVNVIAHTLGVAEFSPFLGTAMGVIDVPQTLSQARELQDEGETGMARALQVISGVEIAATVIGAGFLVKAGKNLVTGIKAPTTSETMKKIVAADTVATGESVEAASKVVETTEGKELSQKLIREFEEANEVNVTDVDPDTGNLIINQQKARDAGRDTATDVMNLQASRSASEADLIAQGKDADRIFTDAEAFLDVGEDADALMSPILKAEKFNAIVSIAKDFKINNPNSWSNDKTVIDNLFELTVGKDIDANQELADSLAKYGLTFDEYVMTVVSGGSDAGKILNKLSQIKRAGHLDNVDAAKNKALEKRQNGFMRTFRRLENIRRGGMVSMIKTAARNLQSAAIRAPMEAFENIMDNTIYALQNDGVIAGGKALLDLRGGWKGSLSHLKYMYRDPILAKNLTEYILDRPDFAKQYTNLFDNVNEYQKATGRGEGGALDTVLSKVEDVVTFANTPNRIQEYLVRRGAFMGEMERLVQREYGIDFLKALKDGKLRDLMANSSSVRPKGKARFEDLIEQSVRRALDVTYAKAPDVPMFKSASDFITRNGLTTVIEFPRFMFNSLELMGQYSGGAFNPVIKRMMGKRGPLDAKDRQNITRNMTGAMAIYAAYQYRTSGQEPASYEQVNTGDGTVMDVTPQFPLRQTLWIGEAINQVMKGTLNNWKGFTTDEMLETFGGASMRTGASNVFIDEIGDMISNAGDLKGEEQAGKLLGATIGNYLSSWGVPVAQVIEAQRISGNRPMTYEDRSGDYQLKDFGESFTSNVERSFEQRYGNLTDPSAIKDMPLREGLFDAEGGRTRVGAVGSGLFGITRFTGNSESAEYLIRKGFNDWELGSQDPVRKVRNEQNKLMRKDLNTIVNLVRNIEVNLRKEYMNKSADYKSSETVDSHVNKAVRPIIRGFIGDLKSSVKEAADGKATFEELATREYNNMSEDSRIRALNAYEKIQDNLDKKKRVPFDKTNGSHLLILKALDEALSTGDTIF
jgi:hypothetical protein